MRLFILMLCTAWIHAESRECTLGGFECTGPASMRQCVDGVAEGPVYDCKPGFICDVTDNNEPCAYFETEPCCEEGTFPVKGNCNRFYICVSNGLRLFQYHGACAPGYEFSPQSHRCLLISNAGCSVPLPTGNRTTTVQSSSTFETTKTQQMTTAKPLTTASTTIRTTMSDVSSLCKEPGQIADTTSCRHYIVCTWASQTTFKATRVACTKGLFFDKTLRQCVFNTNCDSRPMS